MKGIKVPHLVAIAALCWVVLICFQVRWIRSSHALIEEQFDQKVSLALCAAVGSLDNSNGLSCAAPSGGIASQLTEFNFINDDVHVPSRVSDTTLHTAVAEALAFYDIQLPFRISVENNSGPSCDPQSPYCCVINPFQVGESSLLSITFPGKNAYLFSKMWFMLASSIFILLFILAVFILALRTLIRQKRISQWNIDFFNNMAHEFKTPVTNIRLAVQRLVRKHPELYHDPYIDIVRNEDAKLGAQIDGVLQLAQYESNGAYLTRERLDLQMLMQDLLEEMQLQIQAADAHVALSGPGIPAFVLADRFHLSRVFRNLVENALKYSSRKPEINIHLERDGNWIRCRVTDNGVGIQKQHRDLIFNKFHRAYTGNRHDYKGFGLGLSYARMIVADHDGTIQLVKTSAQGSTFEVTLPVDTTEHIRTERPSALAGENARVT